jgi:hypothetical protein
MSRATKIIQLLEAGGLDTSDASTMKIATKGKQPKAGGAGKLTASPGFVYGSGNSKKEKPQADAEYTDDKVDAPVLVGNMFKRNNSNDVPASKSKRMLISMTGLRG